MTDFIMEDITKHRNLTSC